MIFDNDPEIWETWTEDELKVTYPRKEYWKRFVIINLIVVGVLLALIFLIYGYSK